MCILFEYQMQSCSDLDWQVIRKGPAIEGSHLFSLGWANTDIDVKKNVAKIVRGPVTKKDLAFNVSFIFSDF